MKRTYIAPSMEIANIECEGDFLTGSPIIVQDNDRDQHPENNTDIVDNGTTTPGVGPAPAKYYGYHSAADWDMAEAEYWDE